MNLDALKNLNFRDPRILMRLILGVLLLANLVAFYFVIFPLGGSPEELDEQLKTLQERASGQRKSLDRLRVVTAKVEGAGRQASDFELANFTDRRVVYSTLVNEITQAADSAGIKLKDHALQNEEIDGSDTLGMITVNANYEGTYGDLLNFVNRLDRSKHFVIIDSLAATPQQGTNQLNVTMKMNLFVRNTADLMLVKPAKASSVPDSELPGMGPTRTPLSGRPLMDTPLLGKSQPGSPLVNEPVSQAPLPAGSGSLGSGPSGSGTPGAPLRGTPPTSSPLPGSRSLGSSPTSSPLPGSRVLGTSPSSSPLPGTPLKGAKL